jgi:iron complex transport system ATP-binding protein
MSTPDYASQRRDSALSNQDLPYTNDVVFKVRDLSFAYPGTEVLEDISFDIARGKITALMGANGSGKSTLFKLMTKNLKARGESHILLEGRDLSTYRLSELARKVAVVWQHNTAPYDITGRQLVAFGRVPHKQAFQGLSKADEKAIEEAIEFCDLHEVADRRMRELSGGQQQRVWIALGLAQQTPIMFLDEPTTFLDVRYQVMILRLIRRLNRELGLTVVLILHDINQSLELCDELIAIRPDGTLMQGSPQALANEEFLREIYDTDLRVEHVDEQVLVHAPL